MNQWKAGDLLNVSSSYWSACALHTGVRLDVFSPLYDDSLSVSELAKRCQCDGRGMELLVIALVSMGLMHKHDGHVLTLDEGARRYLCKQSSDYMGSILLHHAGLMPAWSNLFCAVKKGEPTQNFLIDISDEEREHFLCGMANLATLQATAIAKHLDLQHKKHLLDLGGGPGAYSVQFCLHNTSLCASVFDLPESERIATKNIAEHALQDRVDFISGDFMFDSLPKGCDVLWMSHILHSYGPMECRALLERVFAEMALGADLYLHDFFLGDDKSGPEFAALFGLNMLALTPNGQTYSLLEVETMLKDIGAQQCRRISIPAPMPITILAAQKL